MAGKPSIAIIGPGNLGRALALALNHAGYRIREVIARDTPASLRRAQQCARSVKARVATIRDARLDADLIWFCVNDDAIRPVTKALAAHAEWRGKTVLHSSGALSSAALQALKQKGASVASAHPMMTFVAGSSPAMRGIAFALEGDARAVSAAGKITRGVGGKPFTIASKNKVLYHAMGSFASPLIIATLAAAERVARAAGIPKSALPKVMHPIFQRTVENYLQHGAQAAFSGPINRGDVATVRKHLAALKRFPVARRVYLALLEISLQSLPVKNRSALRKLLHAR